MTPLLTVLRRCIGSAPLGSLRSQLLRHILHRPVDHTRRPGKDRQQAADLRDEGHDLAEDAVGVEHRLALEDAVRRALVEQHAMAERIEVHVQDRGDDGALGHAGHVHRHQLVGCRH